MNDEPTELGSIIDPWHESFYEALREADSKSIETFVSGEVVFMPSNQSTVRGSHEVRHWFEGFFRKFKIGSMVETQRSVTVQDKLAFEWGAHSIELIPAAGGQALSDDLRFLHVWQAQSDRRWRIIRMMWNSSRPVSAELGYLLTSVNRPR